MEQDRGVRLERKNGKTVKWVGRKEEEMDAKQAERDGEEEREPRRSPSRETGSSTSKLKSPFTARSSKALFDISFYPSIFEEFVP